jgi:hypothetical protein
MCLSVPIVLKRNCERTSTIKNVVGRNKKIKKGTRERKKEKNGKLRDKY